MIATHTERCSVVNSKRTYELSLDATTGEGGIFLSRLLGSFPADCALRGRLFPQTFQELEDSEMGKWKSLKARYEQRNPNEKFPIPPPDISVRHWFSGRELPPPSYDGERGRVIEVRQEGLATPWGMFHEAYLDLEHPNGDGLRIEISRMPNPEFFRAYVRIVPQGLGKQIIENGLGINPKSRFY